MAPFGVSYWNHIPARLIDIDTLYDSTNRYSDVAKTKIICARIIAPREASTRQKNDLDPHLRCPTDPQLENYTIGTEHAQSTA